MDVRTQIKNEREETGTRDAERIGGIYTKLCGMKTPWKAQAGRVNRRNGFD